MAFFVILCVVCICVCKWRAEHWVFISCSYFWRLDLSQNLELNELAKAAGYPESPRDPPVSIPGVGIFCSAAASGSSMHVKFSYLYSKQSLFSRTPSPQARFLSLGNEAGFFLTLNNNYLVSCQKLGVWPCITEPVWRQCCHLWELLLPFHYENTEHPAQVISQC